MTKEPMFRKKGAAPAEELAIGAAATAPPAPASPASVARRGKTEEVQLNLHLAAGLHRRLRLEGIRRGQTLAATLSGILGERLPPE